jgi:hypothetical protein
MAFNVLDRDKPVRAVVEVAVDQLRRERCQVGPMYASWPHELRWECSYKRPELARLLGRHGAFRTCGQRTAELAER